MFEFEDDQFKDIGKKNPEDYDIGLGIAISSSLVRKLGSQILSPEDVHSIIVSKVREIVKKDL